MNFSKSVKKFQKKLMKKGSWVHVAIVVSVVLLLVGVLWPRKKLGIRMVPVEGTTHFKAVLEHFVEGNEQAEGNKSKCILFKSEKCGHCKNLKPEWDKCKNDTELTDKIDLIEYDSTIPDDKKVIEKQGIRGFPTIRLYSNGFDPKVSNNNNFKEYKGERTYATIKKFCE